MYFLDILKRLQKLFNEDVSNLSETDFPDKVSLDTFVINVQ